MVTINAALVVAAAVLGQAGVAAAKGPFLTQLNATTWVIGNDHWNMTQHEKYGTKLYWKGRDLVGDAVGHYVSYNGAANDLAWRNASIVRRSASGAIDVRFDAAEGSLHWVIGPDSVGAYQYFVNRALPTLGEFRTLWRLDNGSFTHGRTAIRDGPLPALAEFVNATKVQDETWRKADGTFLTKYDWASFVRDQDFHGVYGDEVGSWYINPGKDYLNGNHLKQELTVHRESQTGDTVQLNMLHGTHFQATSDDSFAVGKLWGPWLWYLNNGSRADAAARAAAETAAWPYAWFEAGGDDDDDAAAVTAAYHDRVARVVGRVVLADGRAGAGAAVFLGDNRPERTALDMGAREYYATYADGDGAFAFEHVRAGVYGLQAWSAGDALADVTTTLLRNDVVVGDGGSAATASASGGGVGRRRRDRRRAATAATTRRRTTTNTTLDLGRFEWPLHQGRERLFQVGAFDRKSLGFRFGGAPYQHALVSQCPANLTFRVGDSTDGDWCFGQSAPGAWEIEFELDQLPAGNRSAVLTVSLAGYSQGTSADILVNGAANRVGNLTSGAILSDQCLYRSATTAGEWHLFEFPFDGTRVLKEGVNTVTFNVTESTQWRGFMWDSIILEWA